jgi:hypothetical protein
MDLVRKAWNRGQSEASHARPKVDGCHGHDICLEHAAALKHTSLRPAYLAGLYRRRFLATGQVMHDYAFKLSLAIFNAPS